MGVAMALDGYTDQKLSRQAMKAELLDAETELRLAYAWRDQRDEQALHRLDYRLHAAGNQHGVEGPPLWRTDE